MPSLSAAVLCLVVGVSDGDTVKLRCGESEEEKVRLVQIDAPEKKQAFGTKARDALSDLMFGKHVQLERDGTDRYGRTLGRLMLDGTDINFEVVRRGLAWCYRKYLTDERCLDIEAGARDAKVGLWQDSAPIPPWEFRRPSPPNASPPVAR